MGSKASRPHEPAHVWSGSWILVRQPQPARRIWIPKPGTEEKRRLGIPVMRDRALQALAEAHLGTRMGSAVRAEQLRVPTRALCHDAHCGDLHIAMRRKPQISSWMQISQNALTASTMQHSWKNSRPSLPSCGSSCQRNGLRAGVMDGTDLFPTTEGQSPRWGRFAAARPM